MAKADAEKKPKGKSDSTDRWAASRDTVTMDTPDSGRNQRSTMGSPHNAPFDVAFREALTPSAETLTREDVDGDETVVVMPRTRERRDGTVVVDAKCPEGHKEGDGEVVAGTLGKTATCSKCDSLLVAKEYVEAGSGAKVTMGKTGRATVTLSKETRKAAEDDGRGAGPAYMAVQREDSLAEDAKANKRSAGSRRKATRKSAKAPAAKAEAGAK